MTTTLNSTPLAQQRVPLKRLPGSSGSLNLVDDMPRSDSLSHRRKKTGKRGTVKEFINGFRKMPPPPGNYLPDQGSNKRDWLSSLWQFQKRLRQTKWSKAQRSSFKLPDSAVAATTTQGHRYIAITIPIEHAHLEPTGCKSTIAPEKPCGEPDEGDRREDRSEYPEKQRHWQNEKSCITNSGPRFPPWDPTAPDDPDSPRNMVVTSSRELTLLKGSDSADTYLTNPWSEQRQPPSQQPNQGNSSSESFYSTTSELICSDAVTVHIPSPEPSETDTDKYFTPEPAQSRISICGRGGRTTASTSDNSLPGFNFSAPYNGASSRTSSMPGPNWLLLPTSYTDTSYQPHVLSNITSLESLIPSPPDPPRTLHVAPITTVADIKPSSPPLHRAPLCSGTDEAPEDQHRRHHLPRILYPNHEKQPRRVHGLPDIRSTNYSHGSLHLSQPSSEESGTSSPCLTTATSSAASTRYAITPSQSPIPPPFLRCRPEQTGEGQGGSESEGESEIEIQGERGRERQADVVDLLCRYTTRVTQAQGREMDYLLARLDSLEQANTRWTGAVVPILERISRQLVPASSPADNHDNSSGTDHSRRSPSRSPAREGGSSRFGPGYYANGGVFTPARLESVATFGRCDWVEAGNSQHRESRRISASSGVGEGRLGDFGVRENVITMDGRQADSFMRQQQPQNGYCLLEDKEDGDSGDATGLGIVERVMRELIPTTRPADGTGQEIVRYD
ncbi:hypothetical protein B0I37DRAFT_50096 [Chaetomium sp. MPI-CAGE-AT-0009]|nr:hypothetical protein B0I37DRAFT_50096 [Chaetomium sp. MPI-CAGE-AT-0009]